MRRLTMALVALLVAGGALTFLAVRQLAPVAEEAPEVLFVVERGDSLARVAQKLEREGLVRNAAVVKWLARLRGLASKLHAGEYRFAASLAPGAMLERIAAGRVATHEVSLPEGFTAAQIGERLAAHGIVDAAAFAAAVQDAELAAQLAVPAAGLEGYLFPETYRLPRGLAASDVARILVEQFQRAWQDLEPEARERGLEMHAVVTLASIVEKETGAPEERPLIASVFANRLARNMRLESDPTVIYGIPDFDGNLQRRDLDDAANPYNTYQIQGLPPGPIANPGIDSLRAVVRPAETDYLYFVSKNDGTHQFSSSYRDHINAVNRFQRRRASK
ncbi:MAG: endolytic transglycosylase MltG [Myxococcales bacterium]|nr:endolytic transglycosylase MltG [Myxococcales bacterium]MDH5308044.1 endolytic transglycosylase MltG [Myxococcales bacterium]MDH5567017.1 endolytic transglycosylase MltG [Myxococcales bacterium]